MKQVATFICIVDYSNGLKSSGDQFSMKFKPLMHQFSIGIFLHQKNHPRKRTSTDATISMVHGGNIDQEIIKSGFNPIAGITLTIELKPLKITLRKNFQL